MTGDQIALSSNNPRSSRLTLIVHVSLMAHSLQNPGIDFLIILVFGDPDKIQRIVVFYSIPE